MSKSDEITSSYEQFLQPNRTINRSTVSLRYAKLFDPELFTISKRKIFKFHGVAVYTIRICGYLLPHVAPSVSTLSDHDKDIKSTDTVGKGIDTSKNEYVIYRFVESVDEPGVPTRGCYIKLDSSRFRGFVANPTQMYLITGRPAELVHGKWEHSGTCVDYIAVDRIDEIRVQSQFTKFGQLCDEDEVQLDILAGEIRKKPAKHYEGGDSDKTPEEIRKERSKTTSGLKDRGSKNKSSKIPDDCTDSRPKKKFKAASMATLKKRAKKHKSSRDS
jgi:hypothetical protein